MSEYPKRIFVERWNPKWEGWQRLFDTMYEKECERLGIPYEPNLLTDVRPTELRRPERKESRGLGFSDVPEDYKLF